MRLIALAFALLTAPALAAEPPFSMQSEEALLMDLQSGAVLYEKNADTRMPPSSMSKLMTTYVIFEALQKGELQLSDTYPVSEKAWRKGGSKMFVEVGKQVTIADLLRGVIVQSGNDACIVLAEGYSGSEEYFAELLNEKAKELGLTGSNFTNATGWPDENHYMTPRDLAVLAEALITKFPEFYDLYSERSFTYGKDPSGTPIRQPNRNPVLGRVAGADGLKTGHTEAAGYGLTASAERDGRRLVMVLNGMPSKKVRREESQRLLEWGFRNFKNYQLFEADEEVAAAKVWLGEKAEVPLMLEEGIFLTLAREQRRGLRVEVVYSEPIPAPIETGMPLARLVISAPNMEPLEYPLLAGTDVPAVGVFGKLGAAFEYLLFGASGE